MACRIPHQNQLLQCCYRQHPNRSLTPIQYRRTLERPTYVAKQDRSHEIESRESHCEEDIVESWDTMSLFATALITRSLHVMSKSIKYLGLPPSTSIGFRLNDNGVNYFGCLMMMSWIKLLLNYAYDFYH
jgi:hypothetical protein